VRQAHRAPDLTWARLDSVRQLAVRNNNFFVLGQTYLHMAQLDINRNRQRALFGQRALRWAEKSHDLLREHGTPYWEAHSLLLRMGLQTAQLYQPDSSLRQQSLATLHADIQQARALQARTEDPALARFIEGRLAQIQGNMLSKLYWKNTDSLRQSLVYLQTAEETFEELALSRDRAIAARQQGKALGDLARTLRGKASRTELDSLTQAARLHLTFAAGYFEGEGDRLSLHFVHSIQADLESLAFSAMGDTSLFPRARGLYHRLLADTSSALRGLHLFRLGLHYHTLAFYTRVVATQQMALDSAHLLYEQAGYQALIDTDLRLLNVVQENWRQICPYVDECASLGRLSRAAADPLAHQAAAIEAEILSQLGQDDL